jgi:hypothetical protein
VVERVAAILSLPEARPVPPPKHRPDRQMQWGVYAYGSQALEIMRLVLPYLGERRTTKVREVAARMGVKRDPRPCVECGEMFVPAERSTLKQRSWPCKEAP